MQNCRLAPPWKKSTWYSSLNPSNRLVLAMAPSIVSSNRLERWLISVIDMPDPRKSRNSSCISFRTGNGSAAGPGLKLWTLFCAISSPLDSAHWGFSVKISLHHLSDNPQTLGVFLIGWSAIQICLDNSLIKGQETEEVKAIHISQQEIPIPF